MSWTVEIVIIPVSANADEAWAQLEELRDEEEDRKYGTPPSRPLRELCERLATRYPCIEVDPESPWSDGPLINNFGDKLATLGIIGSRISDALLFIIETATGMGFTVFDAGDERIHRPKG